MSEPIATNVPDAPHEPRSRAGGMVLLTLANALYIASAYIITVWLAHELGPRDFGRYGVATAVVTLIGIAVTRGVPVAATREIAADPESAPQTMRVAARVMVPLVLGIAAVALLAAYFIATVLGDDRLVVPLLIGSAAALTYAAQSLPLAWFAGTHQHTRQAVAQAWYAISRLATIVIGGLVAGLAGAVAGFVIAPAVAALATIGGFRIHKHETPDRTKPTQITSRSLLRESGPLVLVAGLVSLLLTIDLLAFKRVGTAGDVGRYAAAATIAHVPFFLLRSVPIVLMPAVAAAHAGRGEVRTEIRSGVGDAFVLLALPTALLITLGDEALGLIFGSDYEVNGLVVAPLAIATAAVTLFGVFVAVETALGTLRIAVATGIFGTLLVGAAAAIGGQGSDVSRAAWAVAVAAAIVVVVHGSVLWARTGAFVPPRALAATGLAAAIGAVTLLAPDGAAWFLVTAGAATLVYAAVVLRAGIVRLR